MTQNISTQSDDVKELYKFALLVREKSHSPYSKYKVGAAIRLSNGKIYAGCNVENSSYGATICAERVAILKAVSEQGPTTIQEVMVVTKANPPWPPCGMCRQVISEFGTDVVIYTANLDGILEKWAFSDIFPQAFTGSWLDK